MNTSEFINKSSKIHDYKYNYSLVEYVNSYTKIKIICPIHGLFEQEPNNHIRGFECKKCGLESSKNKLSCNLDKFIEKSIKIHGDRYDYSLSVYGGSFVKTKIICKVHGVFEQAPSTHLKGYNCPKCALDRYRLDNNEFIYKAVQIHGQRYNYLNVNYVSTNADVKIMCQVHGEFEQTPHNHLKGHGCPRCGNDMVISGPHRELIDFIKEDVLINDNKIIKPQELDIYISDKKLAIEYHGLYWHNDELRDKNYHHNKANICFDKGIQLIQIFENEWLNKKEIVKSILNSKLGANNKIFARKCEIKELTSIEFNNFCDSNHIQGKLNSVIKLGLIYNDKIVCVIGFNRHSKYDYECTRFCNELNINVIGGASRLFKYFLNKYQPESVLSFADRRYSNGGLYKTLGFELVDITKPNYFYFFNGKKVLHSRQSFQKHKLKNKLKIFDVALSEYQNMINNGYKRIFDAGHWKFVWNKAKLL